ncbi:MAG: pyridoxamine 5'-phosphate oxidase family protein [Actinomycetota bacterium]
MQQLTQRQTEFVLAQPMFVVATAAADGKVNVGPKGMDTLRVLAPDRIVWLSLTGSGNETSAHVLADGRMTLLFMSFGPDPLILRVFGTARVVHPRDPDWPELVGLFPTYGGSRQVFDVSVEYVRSSCGTGVPEMDFVADRGVTELEPHYAQMTEDELHDYWQRKNTTSLDGLATGLFPDR